jgi:hypothetical protein
MNMEGVYPGDSKYEGITTCPQHGGVQHAKHRDVKAASKYRLQIWQERLEEFTQANQHKDLKEEISMLRMLLETMWTECQNKNQLMLYSHRIGNLTVQLEKLVSSCERIEKNSGIHMDKTSALTLASKIVDVIGGLVDDAELVDRISSGIIDVLKDLKG